MVFSNYALCEKVKYWVVECPWFSMKWYFTCTNNFIRNPEMQLFRHESTASKGDQMHAEVRYYITDAYLQLNPV